MSETVRSVEESANLIVGRLLAMEPGEQLAIVCDRSSEMSMADALTAAAAQCGAEATILVQPDRDDHNRNELSAPVAAALEAADCLVGLTRSGGAPTYAASVKRLYEARKLRGISMVMRSLANFTTGGALADYDALREEGARLAELWRRGSSIHVTTPAGTDLTATIAGESVFVECGFATEPGQEAAFSDGEVSQMPNQGSAQGTLVVDGPVAHLEGSTEPFSLDVDAGQVTGVTGRGPRADRLRRILDTVEHASNIAEIGIGLNPACRRNGDFEEEKKARGLVHVALGDNVFYGGTVECAVHMDVVLYAPTVTIDDHRVVAGGEIVFRG